MDIECKLIREGGTRVTIGETEYHFAPRDDGAHVATVEDEEHQDTFLAIPEAYGLYRGAAGAPAGDAERAELVAQFKAKFGKAPHGRMSVANLREALSAE